MFETCSGSVFSQRTFASTYNIEFYEKGNQWCVLPSHTPLGCFDVYDLGLIGSSKLQIHQSDLRLTFASRSTNMPLREWGPLVTV